VNNSVGSFAGTREELGKTEWPCVRKYSRNWRRISAVFMDSWGVGRP
jgi:hypothetical protein